MTLTNVGTARHFDDEFMNRNVGIPEGTAPQRYTVSTHVTPD
jgi:hypothetical protein